jgi:hypothetical protein
VKVAIAIGIVVAVALLWVGMALMIVWQQDAPGPTPGVGNALTPQYREAVTRNLAAQRRTAALVKRTIWPVVLCSGFVVVVLIVIMNA